MARGQMTDTVAQFIEAQIVSIGRAPSVREICRHFGWSSTNAAHYHLERLGKTRSEPKPAERTPSARLGVLREVNDQWIGARNVGIFSAWLRDAIEAAQKGSQ